MRGLNIRGQANPGENQKQQLNAAAKSANVRKGIIGGVGSEGNRSTYGNYNPNIQTVRREAGVDPTSGKPVPAKNTYSIPGLPGHEASITQSENTTVSKMGETGGSQSIQSQFENYGPADKKPSTYQGKSRNKTSNSQPLKVGDHSGYQENYVSVTGAGKNQTKTIRNVKTNQPVGKNRGVISNSSTGYKNNEAIIKQKRDSTFAAASRMKTQLFNEARGKMSYLAENTDRKL